MWVKRAKVQIFSEIKQLKNLNKERENSEYVGLNDFKDKIARKFEFSRGFDLNIKHQTFFEFSRAFLNLLALTPYLENF